MNEITFYDQSYPGFWGHEEHAKIRAKIEGAYLGPWCPDCGKKGTKCRKRDACRLRSILRAKPALGVTLPAPPNEWMVARGYGWIRGKRLSESQMREAHRHYAYELAMGKADVGEQVAA